MGLLSLEGELMLTDSKNTVVSLDGCAVAKVSRCYGTLFAKDTTFGPCPLPEHGVEDYDGMCFAIALYGAQSKLHLLGKCCFEYPLQDPEEEDGQDGEEECHFHAIRQGDGAVLMTMGSKNVCCSPLCNPDCPLNRAEERARISNLEATTLLSAMVRLTGTSDLDDDNHGLDIGLLVDAQIIEQDLRTSVETLQVKDWSTTTARMYPVTFEAALFTFRCILWRLRVWLPHELITFIMQPVWAEHVVENVWHPPTVALISRSADLPRSVFVQLRVHSDLFLFYQYHKRGRPTLLMEWCRLGFSRGETGTKMYVYSSEEEEEGSHILVRRMCSPRVLEAWGALLMPYGRASSLKWLESFLVAAGTLHWDLGLYRECFSVGLQLLTAPLAEEVFLLATQEAMAAARLSPVKLREDFRDAFCANVAQFAAM